MDALPLSDEVSLHRAIAQQLAALSAAGVQQVGQGEVLSLPPSPVESVAENAAIAAPAPEPAKEPDTIPQHVVQPTTSTDNTDAGLSAADRLKVLSQSISECTLCDELCANRIQTVFGVGNPNARLCFFGEAPGADEDRLGEPFVGAAGKLLTKIIEAMGMTRDDVYILNVLKCRPPGNRNPAPEEVANCRPFFEEQLSIIKPEFICCLGAVAAQNLLDTTTSISKMRGEFRDWNGFKVMATYHPAYLLRNPSAKKQVWDDMKILLAAMGLEVPTK